MNSSGSWAIGQQMSQEEGQDFIDRVEWSCIVIGTTAPTPGGYFSDPYQGNSLMRTVDGDLFSWTPDIDDQVENDAPIFLGRYVDDSNLLEITASFVIAGDHQVSAAVARHFKDADFADWPGWFAQAIPEFYWFRCEYQQSDFEQKLDAKLIAASPLYAKLANFFENPNGTDFEDIRQCILKDESFERLF